MAIFHLAHSFLKRSCGSSSVATAAYNSGQKLEDNQGSSEYSDYTRKGGILFDEISLPTGTPKWANKRGELWRRLEAREDKSTRRKDAILAHSFNIALPHELTLEQNIFLARDYVREQFTRKGYAVDWAIHSADPRGDSRNIHLHILVPLRKIEGESFGKKARYTRNQLRQQVIAWRKSWANLANRHLKRYGHKAAIDERSLLAQGVKRRPTRHQGPLPKTKRVILNGLRSPQPLRQN
jgi:ATP-dependent exoDNAse (exonuclease V) alpha subunit